jgi:D-alanyl-D-alanine carboxypeptidase
MNTEPGGGMAPSLSGMGDSVHVVISKQRGVRRAMALVARAAAGAVVAVGLLAAPAAAHHRRHAAVRHAAAYAPVFEWIVLDADTGQVLGEHDADVLTYPASLTKMMTLYLTFEALNQGRIALDTHFAVSAHAAAMAPSKLGLKPGDSVSVRNLILGIVTKSANDAAAVLAEGLAGSEADFAREMSWKAHQLGMDHTSYQNASGLPNPPNRTTARDVARLALALYHQFPREYRYFDTREFDFRGRTVRGHDHLLDWYPGADGIKTGFIDASGFNLASSAVRNGRRLIGVVLGGRTARIRDQQMASLLDQGFAIVGARAAPHPAAPVVATAAAAPAPAAAPLQAADTAPGRRRTGLLRQMTKRALQHLAPVSHAEAASLHRESAGGSGDWAIQLGAFRVERAARHVAQKAARLALLRGKPRQILRPAQHDRARLYRARLLHFTPRAARAACAALHRRGFACAVVPPGALRVATR